MGPVALLVPHPTQCPLCGEGPAGSHGGQPGPRPTADASDLGPKGRASGPRSRTGSGFSSGWQHTSTTFLPHSGTRLALHSGPEKLYFGALTLCGQFPATTMARVCVHMRVCAHAWERTGCGRLFRGHPLCARVTPQPHAAYLLETSSKSTLTDVFAL